MVRSSGMRVNLENIAIVLHKPRLSENIGASARAACNMGIKQLIVVDPVDCDLSKILKMATHAASDLVEQMEVFHDLRAALAPFQWVVGTTARTGSFRTTVSDARQLAQDLIPISQKNRVALLLGPENFGLRSDELRLCHAAVTIPTAEFASLNLSQAVMILGYELFLASRDDDPPFFPRLATHHEVEGMFEELKRIFLNIDFINPENPDYWMTHVRRFFARTQLRGRDIKIIRGLCRQIDWYGSLRDDHN